MITRKYFEYNFGNLKISPWNRKSFSVVFKSSAKDLSGTVISNSCGFSISAGLASVAGADTAKARKSNYFFERESCLVLEASAIFAEEDEPYIIGFPLYLAGEEDSIHEFAITYDGVWFNIFCDGILYDRDSPHGGALANDEPPVVSGTLEAVISGTTKGIRKTEKFEYADIPVYCYTPQGFNTWVGDVTVCSFDGAFHIFYLHDRHHHGSRKGRGAHVFCHMSSRNLIDWVDHGEVVNFDKPYLTIGTGNAFVYNGRLYLAFGWHTHRSKPPEQCAGTLLKKRFKETGRVVSLPLNELGEFFPSGASFAESSNGMDFSSSDKIIHYVENPNITVMPDNTLRLCEYGIWKGEGLDSWELVNADFPPRLRNSFCLNTTECPCFFKLGNREFLMIGFTGFFCSGDDGSLQELTDENYDFYDGMAVPMAVKHGDRMIAGAWMNSRYWGSFLMLRELLLLENDRIGSRWIPETLPRGTFFLLETGRVFEIPSMQIDTKVQIQVSGRIEIKFSGVGEDCFLVIDTIAQYAAWLSDPKEKIEFFRDVLLRRSNAESFRDLAGEPIHVWGGNYARKLEFPEKVFSLRIIIHNDPKLHGAVIDAEIAGRYTFATYRDKLKPICSVICSS